MICFEMLGWEGMSKIENGSIDQSNSICFMGQGALERAKILFVGQYWESGV